MIPAINASILVLVSTSFWLWYLRRLDFGFQRLFSASVLAGVLGATLSYGSLQFLKELVPVPYPRPLTWGQLFLDYLIGAGLREETVKLLPALFLLRFAKTRWDGLLLGSCCALGFASGENFSFVYYAGEHVIAGRFFLSPLGHMLISAFWASHLTSGVPRLSGAFAVSVLAHGTYDTLVKFHPALGLLFLCLVLVVILRRTESVRREAFAPGPEMDACSFCSSQVGKGSLYCSGCGSPLRPPGEHREFRDRLVYAVIVLSLLYVVTHKTGGQYGLAADLRAQGAELAANGSLEESETFLRQGLEQFPDDTRMAHYLVITLMKQGKWSEARPILEVLVNSDPGIWTTLYDPLEMNARKVSLLNLADVQFRLGESRQALATLETVLAEQLPPEFRAECLALRAEIFSSGKQFTKALSDLEQALKLAPEEVETNKFLRVLEDCPDPETARAAREMATKKKASGS